MTYPILPEPSFRASQIEEAAKLPLSQNFFVQDRLNDCPLSWIASSHHHETSRPIYGPLASILLDQGFPVEYELDDSIRHTQEQLLVASSIGYVTCDAKFRSDTSEQHFLETFTLLRETTKTTNSRWLQSFLSSNSKHDFSYTMANISPAHIQQCLNLTMHFSLRHLAAKMLSQLYHNFISFPYFFPYY